MGLSTAWALALRGAKVEVIETRAIAAGASGGVVGALAPHTPENWNPLKTFQLESLLMAKDWWAEVQAAGGQDPGYLRSGRLQPLADDHAIALAKIRARDAESLWAGKASWQVIAATGADFEPHSPTGLLIYDDLSARIAPKRATEALAAALRAMGGQIVLDPQAKPRGEAVVHATGYDGLLDLSRAFGRNLGGGQKGQAALLRYDANTAPQIYAGALHLVPHSDGTLAIGSTSESAWQSPEADDQALDLVARARAILPALAEAPLLATWAGIRPRAKTRGPVAGAWPERPDHYLLNGGFKIGFGMAPLLAQNVAQLILTGEDLLPQAFSPEALLA